MTPQLWAPGRLGQGSRRMRRKPRPLQAAERRVHRAGTWQLCFFHCQQINTHTPAAASSGAMIGLMLRPAVAVSSQESPSCPYYSTSLCASLASEHIRWRSMLQMPRLEVWHQELLSFLGQKAVVASPAVCKPCKRLSSRMVISSIGNSGPGAAGCRMAGEHEGHHNSAGKQGAPMGAARRAQPRHE